MDRWKLANTCVYNLSYHIIWCPKYRRSVLVGDVKNRLSELIDEKAAQMELEIVEKTIMPDHVHLFVRSKPTLAPHYIVGQIKGLSSRVLRKEFPKLKSRLPTLWSRSYFIDSVGKINEHTIRKYIKNQNKS